MVLVLVVLLPVSLASVAAKVVNAIMSSPLYYPIVNQARNTMVTTAEKAGIDWTGLRERLKETEDWDSRIADVILESNDVEYPSYYENKFHGYALGNLELDAALEQELAGKAVGARNFPADGLNGEETFRACYDNALINRGIPSTIQEGDLIVDLGCGTGTSTRRLANMLPNAGKLIGLDLSPYMVAIGRKLSQGTANLDFDWCTEVEKDDRIEIKRADIANTGLPDNCAQFVSLCLVMHELPEYASKAILKEAHRILKPGGTLGIMEMDPSAPGYIKLRANTPLFAILRSTEPFLDDYFDQVAPNMPSLLSESGFVHSTFIAATGRHMAVTAVKGGSLELRGSDEDRAALDQHEKSPYDQSVGK